VIILDTNVVSEPLRPRPDPNVLRWLDRQAPDTLHLTAVTVAELWAGIALLPGGRRRTQLTQAFETEVLPLFEGRILDFGRDAARAFGTVHARARAAGNAIDFADCAIAAIAATTRYLVATRNVKDFVGTGARLLNPWDAGP
jgi:predicted nucleic acid-binding protein